MSDILDTKTLEELTQSLDPETTLMIVETFIKETQERIKDIPRFFLNKDLMELERSAHSLKSSSASLGVMQLSRHARSIEIAAKNENLDELRLLIASFKDTAEEALNELEQWKKHVV